MADMDADAQYVQRLPLVPKQLLMERVTCLNIDRYYHDRPGKERATCSCCGIADENFTLGNLTLLSDKMVHPVAVIEPVHCRTIDEYMKNNEPDYSNGYKAYRIYNTDLYYKVNGNVYHYIEPPHIYNMEYPANTSNAARTSSTATRTSNVANASAGTARLANAANETSICYQCRELGRCEDIIGNRENITEDEKRMLREITETNCMISDFKHLDHIIEGSVEIKEYRLEGLEGLGGLEGLDADRKIHYYAYRCENTGYTEILILVYPDNQPGVKPIAGLFIGQLAIEADTQPLREIFLENAKAYNRYYKSVDDVFATHGAAIYNAIKQITARTKIRRSDVLFALQDRYVRKFSQEIIKTDTIEDVENCVSILFKQILHESALGFVVLFLPTFVLTDDIQPKGMTAYYIDDTTAPFERRDDIKLETDDMAPASGTIRNDEIKNHLSHVGNSALITDYSSAELHYCHYDGSVFAVLFQWVEKCTDETSQDSFIMSILNICFAYIMAKTAHIRQLVIDRFREETQHDLSQRLGTLESHIKKFSSDIKGFYKFGENDSLRLARFLQIAGDYNADIKRVYGHFRVFERQLYSRSLAITADPKVFLPYSGLLFNLHQQYNDRALYAKNGHRLYLSEPVPMDREIYADKSLVERILINLIDNAYKYAYFATNVYIVCQTDFGGNYTFTVTNFGSGIPKDIANEIFNRGYRLFADEKGAGLGLYNARRFAKLMDGDVTLIDGTDDKKPVSDKYIPAIAMAESFYAGKPWPEKWQSLQALKADLQKLPSQSQAARDHYTNDLYSEVMSDGANDFFHRSSIIENSFARRVNQPTYRVTFEVVIPQKAKR